MVTLRAILAHFLISWLLPTLAVVMLAGCAGTVADPVVWWHELEGGLIAEQRPPPPLADQPYPNLSTVPDRPAAPDAAARAATVTALAADRANAQYAAKVAPLPQTPAPIPRPIPPPPTPSPDEAAGASLPAASAPQKPPAQESASAVPVAVRDLPPVIEARPADTVESLPAIPKMPPQPAQFAGAPAITAPVPLLTAPMAAPPPPKPGAPVLVAFEPGSADLPKESQAALRNLGHTPGTQGIAVTGFGDSDSADAIVQSQALPLALARARAIAAQLHAAGVASDRMRVSAAAEGHGGAAQLIN